MKRKLVWNDIRFHPFISVATYLFMAVAALLFAISAFLFMNLLGSIDNVMKEAQTPTFLQMHTGPISRKGLIAFARNNEKVEKFQILDFCNLENGTLVLNGRSLADSTQDHGLCVQSQTFDYLLDLDNQRITVKSGEIYIPICYKQEYELKAGDEMQIGQKHFRIAGFLRDSQMNSMMASSKRFLVCKEDYEAIKDQGTEEYLIEFLLYDQKDVNAFSREYMDAGLPSNGPSITYPLIRMMNALSDGLMILVLILVSFLMLVIAILCIRFTLLIKLEEDQREVGMLKAVGIDRRDIRQIYFLKFLVLSVAGAITGFLLAFSMNGILAKRIQEMYGPSSNEWISITVAVLCVALTEAVVLCSIRRTLRRLERVSAVAALAGREDGDAKKGMFSRQHGIVILVMTVCVFIMIIPQNIYSTISDSHFATYMGIGDGEIRMDLRNTDDILTKTKQLKQQLERDHRVKSMRSF